MTPEQAPGSASLDPTDQRFVYELNALEHEALTQLFQTNVPVALSAVDILSALKQKILSAKPVVVALPIST